jgi:hypothetical protein
MRATATLARRLRVNRSKAFRDISARRMAGKRRKQKAERRKDLTANKR